LPLTVFDSLGELLVEGILTKIPDDKFSLLLFVVGNEAWFTNDKSR